MKRKKLFITVLLFCMGIIPFSELRAQVKEPDLPFTTGAGSYGGDLYIETGFSF